ncbi:MAG: Holliday junction resolvase RuvX [Chlorobiaceae bacterium]|nr:Holliday junction resolvase RuvX [Chlorobiaceae bacterium]NTV60721.1 Holliday junction resolvase RuvX [Chlorobiaceae bacterium]
MESYRGSDNKREIRKHLAGHVIKKRVLAIDYGTKRIGLAKSDPLGLFAQPVGTFDRKGLFGKLREQLDSEEIEKVIVGYPLSETGEKNSMTEVVDRFIAELGESFPGLCIETIDEHSSSSCARGILAASGISKKKRRQKGRLDSAAACVMLTDYLENLPNS